MPDWIKGIIAGALAALGVGLLDRLLQGGNGDDVFALSAQILGPLVGFPPLGWSSCLLAGALLYGPPFALLFPRLPGQAAVWRGLVFATALWLSLMLVIMPLLGDGVFALLRNRMLALSTLAAHLAFGIGLGALYRRMQPRHI